MSVPFAAQGCACYLCTPPRKRGQEGRMLFQDQVSVQIYFGITVQGLFPNFRISITSSDTAAISHLLSYPAPVPHVLVS